MNLASVEKILEINPALNSDNLELAKIKGWQVVIRKGEFHVNDLVAYIQIDTVAPATDMFKFLTEKKYRIRPVRLRGNLSYGLVVPLPQGEWKEGDDLTDTLGVKKYEVPLSPLSNGETAGPFVEGVPKTDEENFYNFPGVLNDFKGEPVVVTEKLDGKSGTWAIKDGVITICSRNFARKPGENVFWKISEKYGLESKLRELGRNLAIQGEIIGPGIQKNSKKLTEPDMFVFDVYDMDAHEYLTFKQAESLILSLGLKPVPVYRLLNAEDVDDKDLINKAIEEHKEGFVIRSMTNKFSPMLGRRLSVKLLNPDW